MTSSARFANYSTPSRGGDVFAPSDQAAHVPAAGRTFAGIPE